MADYEADVEKIKREAKNDDSVAKLNASQQEIRENLDELSSGSFPIGWSHFPYRSMPPKLWKHIDANVDLAKLDESRSLRIWWFMGIFLTAGLAGMGAPFWHDVIQSMTQLTRPQPPAPTPVTPVAPAAAVPPAAAVSPAAPAEA